MTAALRSDRSSFSRNSRGGRLVETTFRRKVLGLAAFVILAGTVLNALFGERGVLSLMKAREEHAALLHEVESLEAENESLSNEIRALRSDPLVVERIAREVLGMAKPGEVVLTIRDAARTEPTTGAPDAP